MSILEEMEWRSDFISRRRICGDGSSGGIWETGRECSSGWNWGWSLGGAAGLRLGWVSMVSFLWWLVSWVEYRLKDIDNMLQVHRAHRFWAGVGPARLSTRLGRLADIAGFGVGAVSSLSDTNMMEGSLSATFGASSSIFLVLYCSLLFLF